MGGGEVSVWKFYEEIGTEKGVTSLSGKEKTSEGNENCLHIFNDIFIQALLTLELQCDVIEERTGFNWSTLDGDRG